MGVDPHLEIGTHFSAISGEKNFTRYAGYCLHLPFAPFVIPFAATVVPPFALRSFLAPRLT